MMSSLPPAEAAVFEKPGRLEAFMASGNESIRQGMRGIAWDTHLYARDWGFSLEDIRFPVHLLHGEADINVPVEFARQVAAAIPSCQATFYPDEGHFSTVINHLDRIFDILGGVSVLDKDYYKMVRR
jgi:pimeloyl-ACP methyl ester carboxylesterase